MERRVAPWLLLCLVFFLAVAPWEECESNGDGTSETCAPACHLFCKDSCTQSPLTTPPPDPEPLQRGERLLPAATSSLASTAFPPELPPPRG